MVKDQEIKICCTWNDKTTCANCKIEEFLNCRFDKKKWLFFILNQIPTRLFAIFGLVITGLLYRWWPLIVYLSIGLAFLIFGFEVRIICTHCPHYSSNSKTLRCLGLTGSHKIWKYQPGPMKLWEKIVESGYFFLMISWPIAFESFLIWMVAVEYNTYGLLALLGMIGILAATVIASVQYAYILIIDFCSKCINFSCPMNSVQKEVVDAYLAKNDIMREAWEKAGYKVDKEKK